MIVNRVNFSMIDNDNVTATGPLITVIADVNDNTVTGGSNRENPGNIDSPVLRNASRNRVPPHTVSAIRVHRITRRIRFKKPHDLRLFYGRARRIVTV
jgi:hypothetical protein